MLKNNNKKKRLQVFREKSIFKYEGSECVTQTRECTKTYAREMVTCRRAISLVVVRANPHIVYPEEEYGRDSHTTVGVRGCVSASIGNRERRRVVAAAIRCGTPISISDSSI